MVFVERRKNLAGEVVHHEALLCSEGGNRPGRVTDGAQPEPRQDEYSGPTLGPLDKQLELLPSEVHLTAGRQQLLRLRGRECKLARAQLGEAAAGTEPPELQRGIRPRESDQTGIGRPVRESVVDRRQAFARR